MITQNENFILINYTFSLVLLIAVSSAIIALLVLSLVETG